MARSLKSTESVPLEVDPTDTTHPRGRLLIIDPSADDRRTFAAGLRALGWNVITAADLKTAVDLAIAHQPDVIVSELALPDVKGFHFVRALRGAVDHDVRVIGMTGSLDARAAAAEQAGFDHVYAKPVDPARLADR